MKKNFLLILLFIFTLNIHSFSEEKSETSAAFVVKKIDIPACEWDFIAGTPQGFNPENTADIYGWGKCPVPGLWNEASGLDKATMKKLADGSSAQIPHAWYRYRFDVPAEYKGLNAVLSFGGIKWSSEIWLNGIKLGGTTGGFTPLEIDAGEILKPGEKNSLLIKVGGFSSLPVNTSGKHEMSTGYAEIGNMKFSGITEPVSIRFYKKLRLSKMKISPDLTKGGVKISFNLYPPDDFFGKLRVEFDWCDAVGESIRTYDLPPVSYETRRPRDLAFFVPLRHYKLWTPETPEMYKMKLHVYSDDQERSLEDNIESSFGMREIKVDNGCIFLNGKRIKLRGMNLGSEAFYGAGTKLINNTPKSVFYLSKAARDMGINCFKTNYEMMNSKWIDICDRQGMFLIQEFPAADQSGIADNKVLVENRLKEISAFLPALWNHPSIISYSIRPVNENEGAASTDKVDDQLYIPYIKYQDPSRPVMLVNRISEDFADTIIRNEGKDSDNDMPVRKQIEDFADINKQKVKSISSIADIKSGDSSTSSTAEAKKDNSVSISHSVEVNQKITNRLMTVRKSGYDLFFAEGYADCISIDKWRNVDNPNSDNNLYYTDRFFVYKNLFSETAVYADIPEKELVVNKEFKFPLYLVNDKPTTHTLKGSVYMTTGSISFNAEIAALIPITSKSDRISYTLPPFASQKLDCSLLAPETPGEFSFVALWNNAAADFRIYREKLNVLPEDKK